MHKEIKKIPRVGVGLGYRPEIGADIAAHAEKIDCVEVITESYCANDSRLRRLKKISSEHKTILHGVNLSIASPFLDMAYLRRLKMACEVVNADYVSDHLAMTKSPAISLGHLSPLVYSQKVLECITRNVNIVQNYLQKVLVLENITYHFNFQHDLLPQTDFIHQLVEATGCGILLDLANLYINSQNHGFDPYKFIDSLPINYVVQVHLAGGIKNRLGIYIDSHSQAVNEPTWQLYAYLCKKSAIKTVILEHDKDFPADFSNILQQLERAKHILINCGQFS